MWTCNMPVIDAHPVCHYDMLEAGATILCVRPENGREGKVHTWCSSSGHDYAICLC